MPVRAGTNGPNFRPLIRRFVMAVDRTAADMRLTIETAVDNYDGVLGRAASMQACKGSSA